MSSTSDLYQSIQNVIALIPWGQVTTYGEIAIRAGMPGRARLAGRVLRLASEPLKLPWHRVLRSDGRIAFPLESQQFYEQQQRLWFEGVEVYEGRVNLKRYGWQRNIDAELWHLLRENSK